MFVVCIFIQASVFVSFWLLQNKTLMRSGWQAKAGAELKLQECVKRLRFGITPPTPPMQCRLLSISDVKFIVSEPCCAIISTYLIFVTCTTCGASVKIFSLVSKHPECSFVQNALLSVAVGTSALLPGDSLSPTPPHQHCSSSSMVLHVL